MAQGRSASGVRFQGCWVDPNGIVRPDPPHLLPANPVAKERDAAQAALLESAIASRTRSVAASVVVDENAD